MDLLFIGTIHRAPEFSSTLKKALLESRPRVITLEISPYSWRLRLRKERLWLSRLHEIISKERLSPAHPAIRLFRLALGLPYELKISQEVAQALGVPLVPVDLGKVARKYLAVMEKMLEPQKLRRLTETETHSLEKELFLARFYLREGFFPPLDEEDEKREIFMAQKIQKILSFRRPLRHVGGWRHLPGLLNRFPQAWGILISGRPP